MIRTSAQLKALVKRKSSGDSFKSQILFRTYVMERFLERVSVSNYQYNIIIKGGVLVASMVGIDQRSTLDIDSTLKNMDLSIEEIDALIAEVIAIDLKDNIIFEVKRIDKIMDSFDYPGIRVSLDVHLDRMRTPLKLDFSTGDMITPKEIYYHYPLMFENRTIALLAYNVETVLSEKFETIVSRGILNTRMRDFYDIHMLLNANIDINNKDLKASIHKTFENRNSLLDYEEIILILQEVSHDSTMIKLWHAYQETFDYASNITWEAISESVLSLVSVLNIGI